MMKRFSRLTRRAKLAVVAGSVVPLVLVATAGATHLGSLLLGHVNTANERTDLNGTSATGLLRVNNASTASTAPAIVGLGKSPTAAAIKGTNSGSGPGVSGTSTAGDGVRGSSASGTGVRGIHTATTGTAAGVRAETNSTAPQAFALNAIVNSTAPGSFSAAVRGVNKGTSGDGIGVWGSHAGGGYGVYGFAPNGFGVVGQTAHGTGVEGTSALDGIGVIGASGSNLGVYGTSGGNNGVQGISAAASASGVYGENTGGGFGVAGRTTGTGSAVFGENTGIGGWAGNFTGHVHVSRNLYVDRNQFFGAATRQMLNLYNEAYGIGVQGFTEYFRSDNDFQWYKGGVHSDTRGDPGTGGTKMMTLDDTGSLSVLNSTQTAMTAQTSNNTSFGVAGYNHGGAGGLGAGVQGYSDNLAGVVGWSPNGNPIEAYGTVRTDKKFYVRNDGNVFADGSYSTPAADFAEMLPGSRGLGVGDVLVIGRDGKLVRSTKRYQSNVIGVYSAKPGFVGGTGEQANLNGKVPVAIVGVVAVKVTAVNGAIRPGDSLATSSIAGHAMKASQIKVNGIRFYPGGVIIGKALGTLASGRGVIKMLVVAR